MDLTTQLFTAFLPNKPNEFLTRVSPVVKITKPLTIEAFIGAYKLNTNCCLFGLALGLMLSSG